MADYLNKPRGKHVYLVGNDERGVIAYSYIKQHAKEFIKQRNNMYNIVKAKCTEQIEQRLDQYMEITNTVLCQDCKYYLTEAEELYILEGIEQFLDDNMRYIENFLDHVKLLEFQDKESEEVQEFTKYLKKVYKVMKNADSGNYENEDGESLDRTSLLNMNEVIKFAIENLL